MTRAVWRFRLVATSLVLVAFAFLQDPGRLAADTKLDLTANPWGFLERALHLWDDQGFFGQLQNQAYGYFFPMGPFFGVLTSAGLPGWVVQRLWWSFLLIAAFLGAVRLARLLGISGPGARWAAGLAFALAPRVVSTLGPISSETLVVAIAPWVLIPLVLCSHGAPRWTARRAGAVSAVAVLAAGGVNAVATAAALVLPALWLVTRAGGPARRRLLLWWAGCVALASLWWAVPLLTLGRYSPPFLDWIESAAITTGRSDVATVLRGTDDWVAYVAGPGGPSWPAGWRLVTEPLLILLTGVVAAAGLAGLAVVRRERRFLVSALLLGVLLTTLGHTGVVQGVGAPFVQQMLDGALSPLRNTHKFDVVLRLPLALGVGFAVMAAAQRLRSLRTMSAAVARRTAVVVAAVLVVGAAWPLATGGVTRGRSYESLPGYWQQAADWLAADGVAEGTALVVPGAPFGVYLWGRSQDEPLQPLASSPWAVRDAVPLSSGGNIRLLDRVEARLATGRGSAGLTETLARAGVRYLVVRNDLDTVAAQTPRSILVHEAIDASPGLRFVQGFGPPIIPFGTETTVVDARLDAAYTAVEIYRVSAPGEPVDARAVVRGATGALSSPTTTSDAVLDLADAGMLDGRAAILGSAAPATIGATPVLTDSYRRSEVDFGLVHDNRTAVLGASDPYQRSRKAHDYSSGPDSVPATATLAGVASVTASSSQAWVGALDGLVPGAAPRAALDGDLSTAWQAADATVASPTWWRTTFVSPRSVSGLRIALLVDPVTGAQPTTATVVTDAGRSTTRLARGESLQSVTVPDGPTTTLAVELDGAQPAAGARVGGLREVRVPGLETTAPLQLPRAAAAGGIVLTARDGGRDGCSTVPLRFPCGAALPRAGEDETGIDRLVDVADGGDYEVEVAVRQRPVAAAGRLLDAPGAVIRASASSVLVGDPRNRPQAAVDSDPSTAWIAAVGDTRPVLTLDLPTTRTITGLVLRTEPDVGASRPFLITVRAGGRTIETAVDEDGAVELPPLVDDSVSIEFRGGTPLRSIDLSRGVTTVLPVGVSEAVVRGALDLGAGVPRQTRTGVECGVGPLVSIDGEAAVQTRVATTVGDLLTGRRVAATGCGGTIRLAPGMHRIRVMSTPELAVVSVRLRPSGAPNGVRPRAATVERWDPTSRLVRVPASNGVRTLELAENANAGWTATLDGSALEPIVVDGWRQAFVLPAGAGGDIALTYAPDRPYRAGLVGGAAAVLVLVVLALWPVRRGAVPGVLPASRRPVHLLRIPGSVVAAALFAVAVAGIAAPVPLVVGALASRARPRALVVALLAAAAGVLAALAPWPGSLERPWFGGAASLLALAAVVVVAWPARDASGADASAQP